MRQRIMDILRGRFLVSDEAPKNWRFLLFVAVLAAFMIASSHRADSKVRRRAELTGRIGKLKSDHMRYLKDLQRMTLESSLMDSLRGEGYVERQGPPTVILVKSGTNGPE